MPHAFICDYARTPIGRYAGILSAIRTDDLAAHPIKAIIQRNPQLDWQKLDDLIYGCANQAGEDNRNVARMAILLSGLPYQAPGATINRLCGSGMDAVLTAARQITSGEADLLIAGGVESMSRAPFVMPKAETAFSRDNAIYDTTIGWRFVNPLIKAQYGIDSMPETAENLREEYKITREAQDQFALQSQLKAVAAQKAGLLAQEIVPLEIKGRKGEISKIEHDEHPRGDTTIEMLAKLKAPFREGGTVTAGNASGVNDGAAALLIASEKAVAQYGLKPIARIIGGAVAGVPPRIMGIGPVPATQKLLARLGLSLDQIDLIELNEAFAVQGLAVLQDLGINPTDPRVNPQGGAIALGHPLGMSGARLIGTAALQIARNGQKYGLATMCIGVGQGIATVIERV